MNGTTKEPAAEDKGLENMTPKAIVAELDKYIIGQQKAKRAVAIALRNRMRRLKLPEDVRDEIAPKNILMIGPTGVGKTEIARRLAKLCGAPFLKVEATKYTEVGYVGRDVETMIRDLMAVGYNMVKNPSAAPPPVFLHRKSRFPVRPRCRLFFRRKQRKMNIRRKPPAVSLRPEPELRGRNSALCSGRGNWKTAWWRFPSTGPICRLLRFLPVLPTWRIWK